MTHKMHISYTNLSNRNSGILYSFALSYAANMSRRNRSVFLFFCISNIIFLSNILDQSFFLLIIHYFNIQIMCNNL